MSSDISDVIIDIKPNKKSRLSLKSPKSKWKTLSHHVQDVSHWKNNEATTQCFSGKASFRYLDKNGEIKTRGETINIDQKNTISQIIFGNECSQCCLKFGHRKTKFITCFLNIIVSLISLFILCDYIPKIYSIYIGLLWILIPIHYFLMANRLVMKRMWKRSFLPWMQVYISLLETWAFCDLCSWDERIWIVGPPLILSQLTIINYDAVYFTRKNKKIIIIHTLTALIWKMLLLFGVRFNYFNDIKYRKVLLIRTNPTFLYLDNLSLYVSKTCSMMLFLVGQLYFRFKHKDKAYAIRTNYTIKTNKEWMKLNRKNRIKKKETLETNVKKTRNFLDNKK